MFKGEYKKLNSNGTLNIYSPGDTVLYQGRIYEYVHSSTKSPGEDESSWTFTGKTVPFSSANEPLNPVVGQVWISDSGISYVYYYDGNGYQWIAT